MKSLFIEVGGQLLAITAANDPDNKRAQQMLAAGHARHEFPKCLCVTGKEPAFLSIHRRKQRYHLARIVNTGFSHDPECQFYGETIHGANPHSTPVSADGTKKVYLAFPLTYTPSRKMPGQSREDGATTRNPQSRHDYLGMGKLLALIFQDIRQDPTNDGQIPTKWELLKWALLKQTQRITTQGGETLNTRMFIPNTFKKEKKSEQALLCNRFFKSLNKGMDTNKSSERRLGLILAPLASMELKEFGFRVTFRHLPINVFWMDKDAGTDIEAEFIALSQSGASQQDVIAIFTVDITASGNFKLRSGALYQLPPKN